VIETENAAAGEAFGDRQLEQVVRNHRLHPASELSHQVLSELQRWRPPAVSQQDDITLIVVDVLQLGCRQSDSSFETLTAPSVSCFIRLAAEFCDTPLRHAQGDPSSEKM
jgi:hypothetical protein